MPPPHTTTVDTPLVAQIAPAPRPARGALTFGLGLSGGASGWSGDGVGYGALSFGLRLARVVTPYVGIALGYGAVDQRLLTRLTIGADVGVTVASRYRPHAFAAFVHQHEESLASVAEQPAGAVLGIGTGIRHRAGAHFGAGFDWRVRDGESLQLWLGPTVEATYLTYSSGPSWYFTAGVALTGTLRLW
jgi:hypothetical protein